MEFYSVSKEELEKIASGKMSVDEVANAENLLLFWWRGFEVGGPLMERVGNITADPNKIPDLDESMIAEFWDHAEGYDRLHLGEGIDMCINDFVEMKVKEVEKDEN